MLYHYVADTNNDQVDTPTVCRLSSQAEYKLWHHRLGHPSPTCLCNIHTYVRGVTRLKQVVSRRFLSCSITIKKDTSAPTKHNRVKQQVAEEHIHPGQHLHMNLVFVRGGEFKDTDDQAYLITSRFCSYLIIVDRVTSYKELFLTSTKHPPIQ